MNDRDVHINSYSISWETAVRKAPTGPESTLPGKKGSLDELRILACISAPLSSFSPLMKKFLTVQCVVRVNFLLLIKVLQ